MIAQELEDQLLDKVSINEVRVTIEKLCSIENKIAGTEAEKKVVAYLKKRLTEYGLTNITEEPFDVHLWNPVSCQLKVTEPVKKEIKAVVFPYSMSAKVKGPLVHFQNTSPEIHNRNNGTIGITNWGSELYMGPMRAYFHALDQEAKAVVIASPTEGDLQKIVVISSGKLLEIPVINVTKEDGDYLFTLLESGPVSVEIELDVEYSESGTSQNLVTTIDCPGGSDEEIVVGAHLDAWFKGAAEHSAPAAIVVELARLLHNYVSKGGELKRNVRFLLFGAQESGSKDFYYWCNGSKAYVNNHKDILEKMVAMLSMDSIGFPSPAQNFIAATSDLIEFTKVLKTEASGPKIEYYDPPGHESDHWFFEIAGVPSIYCVASSNLYHTQKDDPEHLDYDAVRFHAEFMKEALIQIANSDIVPLDLFRPLATFQKILSQHTRWKDSPFDLSQLLSKISRIVNRRRQFEKEVKRILDRGTTEEKNRVNQFFLAATTMMNKTIGWIWRDRYPDDVNYLARFEMISDYIDLNASIRALRSMPVSNVGPHSATKLNKQKENPYNWIKVQEPLAMLEEERSKIFQEIESEISKLTKILDTISNGISDILQDN